MSEQTTPRTVEEAAREAVVEVAYGQIATERGLTATWMAPDRARVPPHWRAEAEERARPYLAELWSWQAARMPSVEEVAAAVALAQNVPFVGPKQRRIAERVVALWGAP